MKFSFTVFVFCIAAFSLCVEASRRKWYDPTSAQAPIFQESRFFDISELLRVDKFDGRVVAFGDFDSDTFTDMFVLDKTEHKITVYLWNFQVWKFNSTPYVSVTFEDTIVNVVPMDLNQDGQMDILVTTKPPTGDILNLTSVIKNVTNSGVTMEKKTYESKFIDQVLLLDWNGDYYPDILGTTAEGTTIYLNNLDGTFSPMKTQPIVPMCSIPNSNSFVDLNGDCHADLVLTEKGTDHNIMSIWTYNNSAFTRYLTYDLPKGAGLLSFADFTRDGAIDVAFPVCWPADTCAESNYIVLAQNKQRPLCGGLIKSGNCRKMTAMCVADNNFQFGDLSTNETIDGVTIITAKDLAKEGVRLAHPASNDPKRHPPVLNVGDYNLDGYPDILIRVVNVTSSYGKGIPYFQLWENSLCTAEACPNLPVDSDGKLLKNVTQRTFFREKDGTQPLENITDAYSAAFIDYGEIGTSEVIVTESNGASHALFNNYRPDALFIKALGLNGVCPEWCTTGKKFPDPKPFGVNYPGGVFKFALTDTDGTNLGASGVQIYRTSYDTMPMPYVMFGLGRISNYIQTVFYGTAGNTSSTQTKSTNMFWQGIIPNSYIFAFPYPKENPANWSIELFLMPSNVILFVFIAIVISLIALGILMIYFKRQEDKQDKQIKDEERNQFDFNAL